MLVRGKICKAYQFILQRLYNLTRPAWTYKFQTTYIFDYRSKYPNKIAYEFQKYVERSNKDYFRNPRIKSIIRKLSNTSFIDWMKIAQCKS